jgi:spore coat polysaccharide biosynthesis predicted glycosyltransferase SpsG
VVDSYWIDPMLIADVNAVVPTLAIIDNETRGIDANWYLDQNLGAEDRDWTATPGTVLAGSRYALVREAILAKRIERGWEVPGRDSHVVTFMGGTDPHRYMTGVVASIAQALPNLRLTIVTTQPQVEAVIAVAAGMPRATVLGPTPELPALLGSADVIVSAAGTSALDVCSMGRPTVLVGVVDNQSAGLANALARGIAAGVDATAHGTDHVGDLLSALLDDEQARRLMVMRASEVFDGKGAGRVALALTS